MTKEQREWLEGLEQAELVEMAKEWAGESGAVRLLIEEGHKRSTQS